MSIDVEQEVLGLARAWGVSADVSAGARIALFISHLLEWNQKVNLTGAESASEVLGEHLVDSLVLCRFCPQGSKVVDVGSGGGLPAIPFAILRPDCHLTLTEPRAKRAAFLRMAVRVCGCKQAVVHADRVDTLPSATFSVATSRATFSPSDWLRIGTRLATQDGIVVVLGTGPLTEMPSGFRLCDFVEYSTSRGAVRWSGAYRST